MNRTVAVDCDLRRIHAWDSEVGKVCYKSPDLNDLLRHLELHRNNEYTVLYEIASATDYTDEAGGAVRYNKRRWMLWNMATAVALSDKLAVRGVTMLVSSSQSWTLGYSEEQRREICHPDKSNHDLRECQAMLFFYKSNPGLWQPLSQYLSRL